MASHPSTPDPLAFARTMVSGCTSAFALVGNYEAQIAELDRQIAALQNRRDNLEESRSTQQIRLDGEADRCYEQLSDMAAHERVDQLEILAALEYLWEHLEKSDMTPLRQVINGVKQVVSWPAGTPVVVWDIVGYNGWFGQRLAHQPRFFWSDDQWRVKIKLCAPNNETPLSKGVRIEELEDPRAALQRLGIFIGRETIQGLVRQYRSGDTDFSDPTPAARAAGLEL